MDLYYQKIKEKINIYIYIYICVRKMNQEIKRVERWRRFHTLSTNSFCLTSVSKVFLSFVKGLLGSSRSGKT